MNVERSEETVSAKIVATKQFPLHWVLLAAAAFAVLASLYTYSVAKNYDFLIEAPCDAAFQQCYVRDCSTGDCPPNDLSEYSLYSIPASLFSSCADNGCANLCGNGNAACENIPCSSQEEEECSGPQYAQ